MTDLLLVPFFSTCIAEEVKRESVFHSAQLSTARADDSFFQLAQQTLATRTQLLCCQFSFSFMASCEQPPRQMSRENELGAVFRFRISSRSLRLSCSCRPRQQIQLPHCRPRESLMQNSYCILESAVTCALLPARIGLKRLALSHAYKDWYTPQVKNYKASFQTFQDHFIRPQSAPTFTRSRTVYADEVNMPLGVASFFSTTAVRARPLSRIHCATKQGNGKGCCVLGWDTSWLACRPGFTRVKSSGRLYPRRGTALDRRCTATLRTIREANKKKMARKVRRTTTETRGYSVVVSVGTEVCL